MKKEYHISLKNFFHIINVYADSFDFYNYNFGNNNYKIVRFIDKNSSPIMSIRQDAIEEIFHYKSLFSYD